MLRSVGGRGYRIGIINPTTLVGKEILSILRERGFPAEEVRLLDTAGTGDGVLMEGLSEPLVVRPVDEHELEGLDLLFCCGSAIEAERWMELRNSHGFIVIDLTQPSLQKSAGPESVAGLNLEAIDADANLIISPHPITTTLALVLAPIAAAYEVELCAATIVEPASALDQPGIDEMLAQTVAVLNVQTIPKELFDQQAAFSVYPDSAAVEIEEYVSTQIDTVTRGTIPATIQILKGATFHSHSMSIYLQLGKDALEEEVSELLSESSLLSVAEIDESFGTVDAGGRDEILVSRVRKDPSFEGGFWIFIVS
ncbi:MAG: hypothetical protein KY432_01555, partial [Acidobacteria bacterium]|nr:hypothetical protein [Acidobacteriota bacterium]